MTLRPELLPHQDRLISKVGCERQLLTRAWHGTKIDAELERIVLGCHHQIPSLHEAHPILSEEALPALLCPECSGTLDSHMAHICEAIDSPRLVGKALGRDEWLQV
eukprot:CAMPEP_0180426566 /NCGR_PEP_ID=MMETSP1036_2-20121128/5862_1 /TAXON_ID=632150 /ORGANISM="Azadinium spinosum, Strain 3D9" /LENGTH=105 /DNA_ID=CAMNT_0022432125 /DNA_START=223 /DNA_END=540 /DNA_ORIENTATION=+